MEEQKDIMVMLKHAYVTMSISESKKVCNQIRKIYGLFNDSCKKQNYVDLNNIKQYLHNIKSYDTDVILSYGKQVIDILK